MSDVVLEYRRDGVQSTGRIVFRSDTEESVCFEFTQLDFEPMLLKFAEALRDYPASAGVIQRTDRTGLVPYNLDARTTELFRLDPDAAVKSMSVVYTSPSNVVRRIQEDRQPAVVAPLRAGHSVLADAFGYELYVRFDKPRMKVECPCCGIWASITVRDDGKYFSSCKNPTCAVHTPPKHLQIRSKNGRWASFETTQLIDTVSERFYFPRAWNNGKIWVTHGELLAKYRQFVEEKRSCP